MSKAFPPFCLLALVVIGVSVSRGQDIRATIEFDSASSTVSIHGKHLQRPRNKLNLSFMRSIAGVENLGGRISHLRLLDDQGKEVSHRKLIDGEYLADGPFDSWTYRVDLAPQRKRGAAAHVSWFANGIGMLMLADVLPQTDGAKTSAKINFVPPRTFDINASFVRSAETSEKGAFDVADTDNAIFYLGYAWENGYSLDQPNPVDFFMSGAWNFAPADGSAMAREIYESYERRLGRNTLGRPFIAIAKFPEATGFGQWEAETRGRNITIISSDMPFRTQSLQRLHEQLRHEMFHVWLPNGVNLTGNYDWFYEGFALYQSLKLAVGLNRIRFADFLDTLSRAHTIDSAQSQRVSLIQTSFNRFAGSNTQVYARGMLVAFLCDLAILDHSKGKRSVENVLAELFTKHKKPAQPVDGNTAVTTLLRSNPGVATIVDRFVTGAEKMDWAHELAAAGIEDSDPGVLTSLRVRDKLNSRQKTLLEKLGYNNWRRLSPNSK